MSDDTPEHPSDPFGGLPPELRELLEQLGGPDALRQLPGLLDQSSTGPVNWELAGRVARQVAATGDRAPNDAEHERHAEALALAEHWLDGSTLPAPQDGGQLRVVSRQEWVAAALSSMRPWVEPVAAASTRALTGLAQQELDDGGLEAAGLGPFAAMLEGMDLTAMLQPMGAMLTGLQAGQVLGQLSRQLLGQYELGLPTGPRATAMVVAPNVEEAFEGWELDLTEVAVALALHEAAHRRLFHAVPWLEAHLHGLVAQFANGTEVDASALRDAAQELMLGVDPEDPESLHEAMQRAGSFQLERTPEQERVLERIQGVLSLVGAWARHEMGRVAAERLPAYERIEEVLRRRRAVRGDGEELLEQLLGLDLRPDDEEVGERFVAAVEEARGPETLQRALAHPENLPDAAELADPSRWLARLETDSGVPDDASALFGDLGEAPEEASAEERIRDAQSGEESGDDDRAGNDSPDGDDSDDSPGGGGAPA